MKSKFSLVAILMLSLMLALSSTQQSTSTPPPKKVTIANWPDAIPTVRSFKAWRFEEWSFDERQIVNLTYTAGYHELAMSGVVWARNVQIIVAFYPTDSNGMSYDAETINLVQDSPRKLNRTYTVKGSYLFFAIVNLDYDTDLRPWSFSFDFYLTS